MSMCSWTESGYGYPLFNGNNLNKIKKFLENDFKEYNFEKCEDEDDLEDLLGESVSWCVANIINNKENVNIFTGYQACGDTDQEEMIGIRPMYPWEMKDIILIEKADELLNKYGEILGITEKPDYFDAYYFG